MSRIQLSQPSYANGYARSRGESAAPELWPDHAWVPAFGPTGVVLFDIASQHNAVIVNGVIDADGISFSQSSASGDGILAPATTINQTVGSIFCLVKKKHSVWDNFGSLWNVENAFNNTTSEMLAYQQSTTTNINFYPNLDDNPTIYWSFGAGATTFSVGQFRSYGFSWKNTVGLAGYINGVLTGSQNGDSTWTAIDRGGNNEKLCIGRTYGTSYYTGLTTCVFYVYSNVLTAFDFYLLHQDPYRPFRRRMPVFYSVPSAGGGTDDLTATGITTGAPVLGTPAIGQAHALTASAITTGASVLGTPAVGQTHALSATGITASAPSLDTPAIGQVHTLAAGAITAGSPSVGAPAIGQVHALSADGIATGAPTLGTPELSSAAHSLTPDSITTGAPDLGEPAIGQAHALTAGAITAGAPSLAAPAIGQVHALSAVAITTEAPVLGTPAIGLAAHDLAATGITTGAPTLGTPIIGQVHILTASGITARAPTLGTPSLDWAITDTPACRTTIIPYEDRTTTIPY